MSKKQWPILYSNFLYKMGHYFSDIQYINQFGDILYLTYMIMGIQASNENILGRK